MEMGSTGLLIVSNIKQIGQTLSVIEKYVKNLYIHLNIPPGKEQPLPSWGKLISQLYIDGAKMSSRLDLRVLIGTLKTQSFKFHAQLKSVDMIFSDAHFPDVCERLRNQLNIPSSTVYLNGDSKCEISDTEEFQSFDQTNTTYDNVVLGGTFDRIHLGHKILLSQAVLRACKRLVVGVMSDNTLKSKTLPELIQPVEERINDVVKFLNEIDTTLKYDVMPINDPFGPTKSDPNMDMLVVSEETLRGGHKVNEIRAQNNLKPLEIYCIDVLEFKSDGGPKESKISSSNTRLDLLGSRISAPQPKPNLPRKPYIIGLTGGIASGKSKMSQFFLKRGAYVMDCDKIAHELYEPGQVCYEKLIKEFGDEIVREDGNINRKILGSIVFSNPQALSRINNIVWPELLLETKRRIQKLRDGKNAIDVVIIEAAILFKAGWEAECHEVWSMIIPPEEAISRVIRRNQLSREEAERRVASQMRNIEIVNKSNVVFSSQWDETFMELQADRAWKNLMQELHAEKNV